VAQGGSLKKESMANLHLVIKRVFDIKASVFKHDFQKFQSDECYK